MVSVCTQNLAQDPNKPPPWLGGLNLPQPKIEIETPQHKKPEPEMSFFLSSAWRCEVCLRANESGSTCRVCSTPRKGFMAKPQKTKPQKTKPPAKNATKVETWNCVVCTRENNEDVSVCRVCGCPRGQKLRPKRETTAPKNDKSKFKGLRPKNEAETKPASPSVTDPEPNSVPESQAALGTTSAAKEPASPTDEGTEHANFVRRIKNVRRIRPVQKPGRQKLPSPEIQPEDIDSKENSARTETRTASKVTPTNGKADDMPSPFRSQNQPKRVEEPATFAPDPSKSSSLAISEEKNPPPLGEEKSFVEAPASPSIQEPAQAPPERPVDQPVAPISCEEESLRLAIQIAQADPVAPMIMARCLLRWQKMGLATAMVTWCTNLMDEDDESSRDPDDVEEESVDEAEEEDDDQLDLPETSTAILGANGDHPHHDDQIMQESFGSEKQRFEHQRKPTLISLFTGWQPTTPDAYFTDPDPPAWADASGRPVSPCETPSAGTSFLSAYWTEDSTSTGSNHRKWVPVVDDTTDAEGWVYGTGFERLDEDRDGGRHEERASDAARRRTWMPTRG